MVPQPVSRRLAAEFPSLPERMREVGRYLLDHPEDVALLSMREQARRVGVPPATMTRFAQRLGYAGFDELRALFAASIRGRVSDFGVRAGELAARRERLGEPTLALALANGLAERVAALTHPDRQGAIVDAAGLLAGARRIFCAGHRSCYAPAYHFAYVAGLYGAPTRLLDGPGGVGGDALSAGGAEDALLAVSFSPYTRFTVELAAFARDAGIVVVALTDSPLSPLARVADRVISVPTDLAEAAYVTAPAFAAAEMLAALVIARIGAEGRAALDRHEGDFARRRIYWTEDSKAAS
jgi:DNA-binding MurR/RpiR family transcriptional regulator